MSTGLSTVPPTDSAFLLRDFNARVGCDFVAWPDVLGPYGIGNMNDNGQRLLRLCVQFSLRIMNTQFQGNECRKVI